jgi:exonuclease SbcD
VRILHTGDWHIGKRLYGVDRLDECRAVLDEIARIAEAAQVDAILVAGDNLDRRIVEPAVLAVCLRAFEDLAAVAPVVAVTGNHEDPRFWAEIAPYLAPRIMLAADDAVFTVETRAGGLTVACLPWPDPADAVVDIGAPRGEGRIVYADVVRERLDPLADELRRARAAGRRTVLLGHLMVIGARAGGGERELTLGGTYAIDGASLPQEADYVALGHVHQPQPVPGYGGTGGYCGSPLALDFSGDADEPGVVIVDLTDDGVQTTPVPVEAGRRLRRVRGTMDELVALADALPDMWLWCEVVSDEPRLDTARIARERIPAALRVDVTHPTVPDDDAGEQLELDTSVDLTALYADWLTRSGRVADPRLLRAFDTARDHAERNGP